MFVSGGLVEVEGASIPPQPSDVQNWYALAADDPDVAELLRHFGEDPNFYELFKVYEAIEVLSSRLEGGWKLDRGHLAIKSLNGSPEQLTIITAIPLHEQSLRKKCRLKRRCLCKRRRS